MAILKNTTVSGTGAVTIPIGTTAQRPSPANGMLRFNTTSGTPEVYITQSGIWDPLYPPGSILLFARSSAPDGWIKANGAGVSTTTYAALFANIGYTFGGSGATFNVPDLRGAFPRAWDDGRTLDNGRGFGTYQDFDWKGFYQTNTGSNTFSYSHGPVYMGKTIFGTHTGNLFTGWWSAPSAAIGTAWNTEETRPRNRALLACIKF
jgi:hypothetical protein